MTVETGFDASIDALLEKNSKPLSDQITEQNKNREIEGGKAEEQHTEADGEAGKAEEVKEPKTEEAEADDSKKEEGNKADTDWLFPKEESKSAIAEGKATTDDDVEIAELRELLKDPEFKAVRDAKKANKSVFQMVSEIRGEDPQKMSIESLIKWKGAKFELTDKEIETEISNYEKTLEDSPLTAKTYEKQLRTDRADEQREQMSKYATDAAGASKEAQQQQKAKIDTLYTEVATVGTEMIGKGFFGLTLTGDDAKDFEKYIKTEFSLFRADGSYDVNKLRLFWLAENKLKKIHEVSTEDGKHDGIGVALKDVSRINLNNGVAGRVPTPIQPTTAKEVAQGAQELIKQSYTISGVGGN